MKAIDLLHGMGPNIVVVTSSDYGEDKEFIGLYASGQGEVVKVDIPVIKKED